VWLEGTPSPIVDEAGKTIGVVTVLRDVTSRRALEEELRRKRAEADAGAVAKSQFLANMSHEIRNPLTVVIGYGELLEKLAGLPDKARTYIGRINTGAKALLAIVDDVLDFSRLEAGKIELDPQAFALIAFLDETRDQFATTASGKGLELLIERRGPLPALVRADRRRLQQVLANLIANAIKFTERGQVSLAVGYQPGPDARLRFEVADTGIGISAEDAGRLFERFSQIDGSSTRPAGGSGLGLAIAKGLVEMMGGEIGVESRPGAGSRFWFTLQAQAVARGAAAETAPGAAWAGGPLSILMVEDVAVNRELVSDLLCPFDIRVTGAADGAEAVQAARDARFDAILMDLQMPRMDGLAAARAIRADTGRNCDTPILALSANVFQPQVDACLQAGMNDYIRKPIDVGELLAKLAHWTRGAGLAGPGPSKAASESPLS
jgi:signal transduction histidine kinase/ActR/RegA family two-component response regulator